MSLILVCPEVYHARPKKSVSRIFVAQGNIPVCGYSETNFLFKF